MQEAVEATAAAPPPANRAWVPGPRPPDLAASADRLAPSLDRYFFDRIGAKPGGTVPLACTSSARSERGFASFRQVSDRRRTIFDFDDGNRRMVRAATPRQPRGSPRPSSATPARRRSGIAGNSRATRERPRIKGGSGMGHAISSSGPAPVGSGTASRGPSIQAVPVGVGENDARPLGNAHVGHGSQPRLAPALCSAGDNGVGRRLLYSRGLICPACSTNWIASADHACK